MDAPRYRIGNDLSVFWAIHNRDGSPFDMEGMDVRLFVTNERGRKEVDVFLATLPDGTINNVIRWDFKGEDQRVLGLHTLTVEISDSATHREIIRDYCQAFELVGRSELETEEGDANISIGGDLILSSKLDIYRFEATNVDLSGIKESIHDLNETIKDINEEALEIKVTINGIQSQVNDIGTEMTTKASVDSVIELGDQITEVQTNVAEQTIKVNSLGAEIATKASAESVTQIADELAITNESLAEQVVKVTDLTAEVSTKASSEMVTEISDNLKITNDTLAEQSLKVDALSAEISTKASAESVLTLEGDVTAVEKAVAEQNIKVEGLEASIESKVSKEEFNEKTGELDTKYTNLKQTADNLTIEVGEQGESLTKVVADVNGLSVRVDDIGEAQANYDNTLSELTDILSPEEMSTQIGKGVVLSTIIATRDADGNITAGMNASSVHSDPVHGRVVFAGGVKNKTDWTKATGIIYEDGHIVMNSGEFGENVKIGNAMFRAVLEGDFDLFSYPENGTLVPLFQVNKDARGKITSIASVYDMYINGNLIVEGDTASGGTGGSTSVGIQGILVNGKTYTDENGDGIIDLGVISGGGGLTSVSWSDVQGRPTALSQFNNDLGLGTLAYKNGLTASDVGALSTSGGTITGHLRMEFNPAVNSSGMILIKTGDATKYPTIRFDGDYSWGSLGFSAANQPTFFNNSFVPYILYHTGNLTANAIKTILGYTPLSTAGGDVYGTLRISGNLGIKNHYIFPREVEGIDANWIVTSKDWAKEYTLIHSGNIGSQSVNHAASANTLSNFTSTSGEAPVDCNNVTTNGLRYYTANGPEYKADGSFADYFDGSLYTQAYSDIWVTQIAQGYRNGGLFTRSRNNGTWTEWRKVAYIGDNVASAQALTHSNGTVGAVVNSSGNVTIGASDFASSNYNLAVLGKSTFRHAILADRYNGQGNTAGASFIINKSGDYFGIGASTSLLTYLSLGSVSDNSGTWKTEFMTFANNGDVGIGTTAPQYKLDVNGTAKVTGAVTMSSTLNVGGNITIGNTISANRDASSGAILNSAQAAWKAECYSSYVRWSVYKGDGTAAYNLLYLADNGNVGIDCNPSFKLHVNGTAKINDIVRLGANLYVSQDSTAYGLQLWGDADGGYLGVHAKGSFKSTNAKFGYDGSSLFYGAVSVLGTNLVVSATGNAGSGGAGVMLHNEGGIEISHATTPFIDFHYANSTSDYSVRLICRTANTLAFTGSYFTPWSNGGGGLGTESVRWNILWVKGINTSGNTDVGGALSVGAGATITGNTTINGNLVVAGDISA